MAIEQEDNKFSVTIPQPGKGAKLTFSPMSPHVTCTIADTWKYPPPYDFYDATADPEDYEEFVNPEQWPQKFWQVRCEEDLIGFFTASPTDDRETYEISLGLSPDLTGGGLGLKFVQAGLETLAAECSPSRIVLSVAAFNERAMKVYERAGFRAIRTYSQPTNGSVYEFVEMELLVSRF